MRHHNSTSTSCFSFRRGHVCTAPYCRNYTYTRPTPERTYIKVVKFVAEHPGCKRIDIIRALWRPNAERRAARGEQSMLFANLLYNDLIDYDSEYEYYVTQDGVDLLRKAGIKELNVTKSKQLIVDL